jgi:hypothetical protein
VNPAVEPRRRRGTPSRARPNNRTDRHKKCADFLHALYIPERLRGTAALWPTLRCKAGNRANVLAVARERAEAKARSLYWAKLLILRERVDEHWTSFLRSLVAVSALLVVSFFIGLGLQGALNTPERRTPPPKAFSMTSTVKGRSTANASMGPIAAETVKVRQNDLGQVVEVRASDPGSVLVGFCQTMMITACDPVELAWSEPPHPHLRFGLYRNEVTTRAIQIRRDPGTRQWVAGDGREAIDDFLASSLRISADRLRVRDLR